MSDPDKLKCGKNLVKEILLTRFIAQRIDISFTFKTIFHIFQELCNWGLQIRLHK